MTLSRKLIALTSTPTDDATDWPDDGELADPVGDWRDREGQPLA